MAGLTAKRLKKIKDTLLAKRDEYRGRTSAIRKDVSQRLSADSGERVVELENSMVLDELNREAAEELQKIDVVLDMIDSGMYGICTACREEIDYERLAAYPLAATCLSCAELDEMRSQKVP